MEIHANTSISPPHSGFSGSQLRARSEASKWKTALLPIWRRAFENPEPTRVRDLMISPVAVAATFGMVLGMWSVAHLHFLDPAFIAYSIGVDVGVQLVILLLTLGLAFISRRKAWSGVLFAIGIFSFLALPQVVRILLPGVGYRLDLCIGMLGAAQITRTVNIHRNSRYAPWSITVAALLALCALAYGPARELYQLNALPKPPLSPSVVVIIVDTLRADHLSPYGYARDTSPFLNHLAQQGVLFENAISPSSWTLPSHGSMLTGLYPHEDRVETEFDILSRNSPTLGDAMANEGYRTAAFSANYLYFSRDHGFIHGFSHFEEFERTLAGILEKVGLSRFIFGELSHLTNGQPSAFFGRKNAATAEKINEHAIKWIESDRRPFFVVLNYFDVHEPVLPPEPYMHMYTVNAQARSQSMNFEEVCARQAQASCASDRPQFVDVYDGSIRYLDQCIQQLLSQLKGRGLLKNTIVVVTSDHGQEFGDHGIYGHHQSLYRGEIQVPLIIWKPGLVPESVRVTTPVSTTDIPATILDLTGVDHKPALPGDSLAALWRPSHAAPVWPDPISELARLHWFEKAAPNYNGSVRAIVTPQWHYIHQEGRDFLFDWKADLNETHDLCASQPKECAALRARLQTAESSRQQAN
jgi:arylsulfatase A-like enzyme